MDDLLLAVFEALNEDVVKSGDEQALVDEKIAFLEELADVLEYGIGSTDFGNWSPTLTVLTNNTVLEMEEFGEIVNAYEGRLNFALFLCAEFFTACLDEQNHDDFGKFHKYFWYTIAHIANNA